MKVFPSDPELSERMSLINDGGNEFVAPAEPSHDGVVVGMGGRCIATFVWTDQDRNASIPRKIMRASV
jgi:tRNA A22 N-methylase